jgi:hypothetical protein
MVSKHLIFKKEYNKRQKYNLNEINLQVAKSLFFDLRLPIIIRFFIYKFFISNNLLHRSRFNNLCIKSGNTRSVSSILRMNRLFAKNLLSFAKWSGIRKSSW